MYYVIQKYYDIKNIKKNNAKLYTKEQALNKGYDLSIEFEYGDDYDLYIDEFDNLQEAEEFLKQFKKNIGGNIND